MPNSKSQAGTNAQRSTKADVTTSSSHNAKPHVVCCAFVNGLLPFFHCFFSRRSLLSLLFYKFLHLLQATEVSLKKR